MPPETAHGLTLAALRLVGCLPARRPGERPIEVMGLRFPGRVGVAAGFDKDGVATAGLAQLGFGFVEVGTVTPVPQPGNPQPRVFRLAEDDALVNRLGFNSAGVEAAAANLRRRRAVGMPVGVNIGKNRSTPLDDALRDYAAGLAGLYDLADYVTVNLSSPNTPGLRDLQAAASVGELVAGLAGVRKRFVESGKGRKPMLVKLAPDLSTSALAAAAEAALAAGADGFVAVNTTLDRPARLKSPQRAAAGGLSGAPLLPKALATVRTLRAAVGEKPAVIGVGGVADPEDVAAMLDAGADLVQVYTALVFGGLGTAARLIRRGRTTDWRRPRSGREIDANRERPGALGI